MPSNGIRNVSKAASTGASLTTQWMNGARGKSSPTNQASKQPSLLTTRLLLHCPPRDG